MTTTMYLPNSLQKVAITQANKFTFRSSILRNLIAFQLKAGKGELSALSICRHYVNSKGESPYEELYKPVKIKIEKYLKDRPKIKARDKAYIKYTLHNIYKNKINDKIYSYTIQSINRLV